MSIENFKSFNKIDVINFGNGYNVVIGKNNSGKSSLLSALSLNFTQIPHLSESTKPYPDTAINQTSKVTVTISCTKKEVTRFYKNTNRHIKCPYIKDYSPAIIRKKTEDFLNSVENFEFRCDLSNGVFSAINLISIPFEIDNSSSTPLKIQDDKFISVGNPTVGSGNDFGHDLIKNFKETIYLFNPERFSIGASSLGTNQQLIGNSSNLPEVIDNLKSNPGRFDKFNNLVQEVFPEIQRVTTVNRPNNQVEIMLWTVDPVSEREDLSIGLNMSGSGIGQVLSIIYVVMTSTEPRTIIIDEPQSFLHPGAIRKLFHILNRFPQHQYIFATHSTTVINSATDSSIIFLEKENSASKARVLDKDNLSHIRDLLNDIGVKITDIFGADNILWVEGPTEERFFPLLLNDKLKPGTQICSVKNTGDLDGKKAELVFDIYSRISGGNRLVPPAICFIFDSEYKSQKDKDAMKRKSNKSVFFLDRIMFENYILNPSAISAVMAKRKNDYEIEDIIITPVIIEEWFQTNFKHTRYYHGELKKIAPSYTLEGPEWKSKIHAASFLENLYESIFGSKYVYRKTTDSIEIAKWIFDNDYEFIETLRDEICNFIEK